MTETSNTETNGQPESFELNTQAVTRVTGADGGTVDVPFGSGLREMDQDGLYCHLWSNGFCYKHPETPETGFTGILNPKMMFLDRLASLPEAEAVSEVKKPKNEIRVVEDSARVCLASRVITALWGSFGHGKTSFAESFSMQRDESGKPFASRSIEIAKTDATAFDGLYFVDPNDFVMKRSLPETAAFILNVYRETGRLTFLLYDEMTLASLGQQAASLRSLTHFEMGGVPLGRYMMALVAANPQGTVTKGLNSLGEQVLNRMAHFPWFLHHEVWYERWSRGFIPETEPREPEKEPSGDEKAFVTELFKNNPAGVEPFESSWKTGKGTKRWSRENLVPYKSLEMSPRSLTDFMKVRRTLYALCAELGVPLAVRQYYAVFIAKGMLGEPWAESVQNTVLKEEELFGGFDEIAGRLSEVNFDSEELPEHLAAELLYRRNGKALSSAEEVSPVLSAANDKITSRNSDAITRTRALTLMWAVLEASSVSDPAFVPTVVMEIADAVVHLSNHPELREGMPERLTARFVPEALKQQVNEEIQKRSQRESSHV